MKKESILVLAIPIVTVLILFGLVWNRQGKKIDIPGDNQNTQTILFYGDTCPHCKIVEDWLTQNPTVDQNNPVSKKEVYQNQDNAQELSQKAKECQITGSGVGVPFLYDRGECIIGDQPIIDYLKKYL
ncbi:MAG: hypothetical protein ABID04_03165 [Patescibacteria group bacterium]